jgi:hypothetical protein
LAQEDREANRRAVHTVNTIDLDQIFLYSFIVARPAPAERGSIRANASETDIGGLGNIDAEDVDELGNGFP